MPLEILYGLDDFREQHTLVGLPAGKYLLGISPRDGSHLLGDDEQEVGVACVVIQLADGLEGAVYEFV